MKLSDHQIDASMKAYVRKWMKFMDQPRASTTLGYFFTGLFTLFWSSSLTQMLGFDMKTVLGSLVFIGFLFLLIFLVWLLIRILTMIGINRSTRSALLLSAVIGPYVFMIVYSRWNSAVVSHISGFLASILAFLLSILLDKSLTKYNVKDGEVGI